MNAPRARVARRPVHGVLLLDKPIGLSSNQALQKAKWLLRAEKAGHTGTLDPLATGVLPLCFGAATKFSQMHLDADKAYETVVRLGVKTSTADAEGEVISERPVSVTPAQLEAVVQQFTGPIAQVPPMHSALKKDGKALYEYARAGIEVEREARHVTIYALKVVQALVDAAQPAIKLIVDCSKGTYIRTLAEDIGAALGCGAHLIGLRRTAIAHFDLRDGYNWQQLEAMTGAERDACVLPPEALMPDMPRLQLDAVQIKRLAQGQRLGLDTGLPDGKVCLYGPQGFIGTGLLQGRRLAPERLLSEVAKQAAKTELTENFGVEQ